MCSLVGALAVGAGMLGSVANASAQSQAIEAQNAANDYNAAVALNNADLSAQQAQDALDQGEEDAFEKKLEIAQEIGKEKAAYSASGVELTGTPSEKLSQTAYLGQYDVNQIYENAESTANDYLQQQNNYINQANLLQASKQSSSGIASILSGMTGVATGLAGL